VEHPTIRIGTWNVERASAAKNSQRLALIQKADADIWVLTETQDALDLRSRYNPVNSDPQPGTNESVRWVSIWSRFALFERVAVRDIGRTAAALYPTAQGKLLVYGTVLPGIPIPARRTPQRIGPNITASSLSKRTSGRRSWGVILTRRSAWQAI